VTSRYPATTLHADAVLVEDGAITTTGAVSSAFDLGLHVVKKTLGVEVATGTARLALLQQARVDKAKQPLSGSAWSIAQITEAVGYADVPTFSRLFASRVVETPARYRRRQA
jgi:transcriptional regulator GlxA family with amidase domain